MRILLALMGVFAIALNAGAATLPIFDSHLHYSHDAWEQLPPKAAIAILRKAGLKAAMVSSSSDDGTQKLYAEAPDLVIPVLRPYRNRGETSSWVRDASIVAHLEARLKANRYVAIGEYHVFGADADLPVVRRVVELARENKLYLHSHSDAEAIERQFKQDPNWHSAATTPATARSSRPGAPPSWSFQTGSWLAPIPSRRSAGTSSSSTRTGRGNGSPICRLTWPNASPTRTARRCSARC